MVLHHNGHRSGHDHTKGKIPYGASCMDMVGRLEACSAYGKGSDDGVVVMGKKRSGSDRSKVEPMRRIHFDRKR